MAQQQKRDGAGAPQKQPSWVGMLAAPTMLLTGTAAAVLTKAAYELESIGIDGAVHHFEKPWALTATMFLGMAMALPVAYWQKYKQRKSEEGSSGRSPLDLVFDAEEAKDAAVLSVPALLDLAATALTYFGLVSVTASVYQMLRGAMLVFAAMFGVALLKRKLNGDHRSGIVATLIGVVVVGCASLLSGEGSAVRDVPQAEMLVGLLACLAGQAMQAAQVTSEEYLMAKRAVSPTKVVGYEGLFGAGITLAVLLPLMQITSSFEGSHPLAGLHEDSADTLVMLANNPTLVAVLLADLVAFAGLNLSGMVIIHEYGAVYKAVLEAARTLTVWLVGLGLYYGGSGAMGEGWTDYSWAQLAGFGVLVVGTRLYSRGNAADAAGKQVDGEHDAAGEGLLDDRCNGEDVLAQPLLRQPAAEERVLARVSSSSSAASGMVTVQQASTVLAAAMGRPTTATAEAGMSTDDWLLEHAAPVRVQVGPAFGGSSGEAARSMQQAGIARPQVAVRAAQQPRRQQQQRPRAACTAQLRLPPRRPLLATVARPQGAACATLVR